MNGQIPRAFGSVLLLLGAFAVGGVLHAVFVEGTTDALSPVPVGGVIIGAMLIVVGLRLEREFDPSRYVADEREEGDEVNEEWPPVPDEMLKGLDPDGDYETDNPTGTVSPFGFAPFGRSHADEDEEHKEQ